MAGRLVSEKLSTVPSTSLPVSVTVIEAASSAPLGETLSVVGASLTDVTVMVAVASEPSASPPSSLAAKSKVVTPLYHQGHLYGLSGLPLRRRAEDLLARFGVADRAADRVDTLSGGLQRRVELAKSLLHQPSVLILDEPSTGLDPAARDTLMSQLLGLRMQRLVSRTSSGSRIPPRSTVRRHLPPFAAIYQTLIRVANVQPPKGVLERFQFILVHILRRQSSFGIRLG